MPLDKQWFLIVVNLINNMHTDISKNGTMTEHKDIKIDEPNIPIERSQIYEIIYLNVFLLLFFHLAGLYGLYLGITSAKGGTLLFTLVWYNLGGYGITAGAHRLWTHRTYKAKPPLEFITMLCNCIAFQQTVDKWVRDHRLHHKYSDTEADPHNANRGFFYSHIGWLMVRKSDLVKKYGKTIDNSDVTNNPIIQFQKKYAIPLFGTMCFILPTVIPIVCFGEELNIAWHMNMLRYAMNLNASLFVNSVTHIYGNKPYDANILPTQNMFVSLLAGGEGFHNYHHAFPWDYRTAEIGNNLLNLTTWILDLFAWMGWTYDLKAAKPEMIKKKIEATGDGTNCWGFRRNKN